MKYQKIHKASFISRPNRFIAECLLDGEIVVVHVKNTGRCRELLLPGATVYLDEPVGKQRRTKYDLIAVEKQLSNGESLLINMDSSAPNDAAEELLRSDRLYSGATKIRREVTVGDSRFDFCIEDKNGITYLEVKGVTLENGGIVSFPDAPTERGVKHIDELISLRSSGFGAAILFVIQMKGVREFRPNEQTHPAFAHALRRAEESGVAIYAYDCTVTPDSMVIDAPVKINLKGSEK